MMTLKRYELTTRDLSPSSFDESYSITVFRMALNKSWGLLISSKFDSENPRIAKRYVLAVCVTPSVGTLHCNMKRMVDIPLLHALIIEHFLEAAATYQEGMEPVTSTMKERKEA